MAAINFPASPSNGDTHQGFVYNSTLGVWQSAGSQTAVTSFTGLSDTPSTLGTAGQIAKVNSGATALEFADQSGVTIYATIDDLPLSGNTQGDLAHVTANNTLYFWNGSGWYKIALINNSPSISNVNSSYTLSDIGVDTVITIIAEDPEGLPITYSIASDTSGNTATVVQGTGANTNIFTITPSTDANDNGTFSLTFRASDGVNIATAPASFTLNIVVTVENSNYTHALFSPIVSTDSLDNTTILDSSSSSHTITTSGNATQTGFSPFRAGGYSTYFGGSDYLTIADTPSLELGSSSFTIEAYFWVPSTSGIQVILSKWLASSYPVLFYMSNGTAYFAINNSLYGSGGTVVANQWNHLALTRNGNDWNLWLNGTSVYNTTNSITVADDGTTWNIGRNPDSGGVQYLTGYISDLRVVIGTAVYTSAFTPPTERLTAITNTSLLTCHLPYIADGSTNEHTITVNGNVRTEAWAPYDKTPYNAAENGGSIYFDGTGDWLTVSSSTELDMGTGDFTIDGWLYQRAAPADYQMILSALDGSAYVCVRGGGTGGQIEITGVGLIQVNLNNSVKINTWYHLAITRSSGTWEVFINGKSIGTASNAGSWNIAAAGGMYISRWGGGTNYEWPGFMSNLRIVKGTALYTSNFTPPTAPSTAITNTSLLLNGTNAGVFDKSSVVGTHDVYAGIESSTTQTKFNSASIRFDGSGYIRMHFGLVTARRFNTEDFTLEAWVYRDVQNVTHTLFASGANLWTNSSGFGVFIDSNNELIFTNNNITTSSSGLNFPANTWKHVAVARDYDQVRMFVDGTLVATYVRNWSMSDNTMRIGTQSSSTQKFSGYMDDIRVTHGLARYTANFTPPTEALEG